jgi:hypothetical protein
VSDLSTEVKNCSSEIPLAKSSHSEEVEWKTPSPGELKNVLEEALTI